MLLDVKKQFRMEVKRNSGLGWYRSLQVVEHCIQGFDEPSMVSVSEARRDASGWSWAAYRSEHEGATYAGVSSDYQGQVSVVGECA